MELEKERFGLRFKSATEVMANPMDLRTTRRTVARLKTALQGRASKAKAT
ncbi:MAG: 50S ribosomal protein L29 [Gemmatimonadales bacterium]|nr:50S ribosomal protein L29 [Gemmatimonadales bacterium]